MSRNNVTLRAGTSTRHSAVLRAAHVLGAALDSYGQAQVRRWEAAVEPVVLLVEAAESYGWDLLDNAWDASAIHRPWGIAGWRRAS